MFAFKLHFLPGYIMVSVATDSFTIKVISFVLDSLVTVVVGDGLLRTLGQ